MKIPCGHCPRGLAAAVASDVLKDGLAFTYRCELCGQEQRVFTKD